MLDDKVATLQGRSLARSVAFDNRPLSGITDTMDDIVVDVPFLLAYWMPAK
jgi:hypothetical protein